MAPPEAVKFVLLKLAIPLLAVLASSMVTVLPAALALAILNAPDKPFNVVTPLPLGQAAQVGAPAVDTRHKPALPVATELKAAVPLPTITPLAARDVAPVPPLATVNALLRDKPPVTILRSPVTVTVRPLWVMIEFSMFCDAVNRGIVPFVPPLLVTVPVPAPVLITV